MSETPELPRWSDLLGICPNIPGPAPDVTTADVRERYMSDIRANEWGAGSYSMDDYGAAFDRGMAAHDAEVGAKALRDAAQHLVSVGPYDLDLKEGESVVFAGDPAEEDRYTHAVVGRWLTDRAIALGVES